MAVFAGDDVLVIKHGPTVADVTGIANHTVKDLRISTVAGLVMSHKGPVVAIMHQYAHYGKGKTIHSCAQIEHYKNLCNDKSRKVKGGTQSITTLDGYILPLSIRGALQYLDM